MKKPTLRLPFLLTIILSIAARGYAGEPTKWSWIRNNSGTEFNITLIDNSIGAIQMKEVAKDPETKYPYTDGLGNRRTLPHFSVLDKNERMQAPKDGLNSLEGQSTIRGWDTYNAPIYSSRGEVAVIPAYCTVGIKVKSTATRYNLVMRLWGVVGPNRKKNTNTLTRSDIKLSNGTNKAVDTMDTLGVITVNPNNLGDDNPSSKNYFITINEP